jgi:hypothetical protein
MPTKRVAKKVPARPRLSVAGKLEAIAARWVRTKRDAAAMQKDADGMKPTVLELLEQVGGGHEFDDGNVHIKLTMVSPTSVKIDQEKLRKLVGDDVYITHCTTPQFDPKALETAIARGLVTREQFDKASFTVASTPYVKVTEKGR